MPARHVSPSGSHPGRRSRLRRPAARWMFLVPIAIAAATLALLVGLIVVFNRHASMLSEDQGVSEQILGVLASDSGRVAKLTGRIGASVRFVYDPVRKRGALVVIRLADPGDDLVYRLWLIDRNGPHTVAIFMPAADHAIFVPVKADFTQYQSVAIAVGPRTHALGPVTQVLQATLASEEHRIRPPRSSPLLTPR